MQELQILQINPKNIAIAVTTQKNGYDFEFEIRFLVILDPLKLHKNLCFNAPKNETQTRKTQHHASIIFQTKTDSLG